MVEIDTIWEKVKGTSGDFLRQVHPRTGATVSEPTLVTALEEGAVLKIQQLRTPRRQLLFLIKSGERASVFEHKGKEDELNQALIDLAVSRLPEREQRGKRRHAVTVIIYK